MVAGFVAACSRQQSSLEAFRMAVACGSGTAFSSGLTEEPLVRSLLSQIEIVPLHHT